MISVFNLQTAHLYGDALPTLLKCRYREFVLRHKYKVPFYNGMEYDQYDTPATVYFVWHDGCKILRAGLRIVPTDRPYMIRDLWSETVEEITMPNTPRIWEASRLFIDKRMNEGLRHQAHGEILCAMLEFGLRYGLTHYIAIAAPHLWDFTFRRCGWPADVVGPTLDIGHTEKVQTCIMHVTKSILQNVQAVMNTPINIIPLSTLDRDENTLIDAESFKRHGIPRR